MKKQIENKSKRGRLPRKAKKLSLNAIMIKKDSRKSPSTKRPKVKLSIKKKTKSSSSRSLMKQDQNCWKCREPNTELNCTKCTLTYHSLCIHAVPEELTENWQCPSCRQIEEAKHYWTNRGLDRSLLSLVVKRLYYDPQFKDFRNTTAAFGHLSGILDLNKMHQKVKNKLYDVPEEILFDVKNIRHKCLVYLPENVSQVSKADDLLAACIREINDIKSCSECYLNRRKNIKDRMIRACERPHLLVWAKFDYFPYWPAKVMSYNDKCVSVEFFDDHSTAEVEVDNCLLYSKEYPLDGTPPASIAFAVLESRKNVENIISKFGAFEYASQRVPLDVKRFDEQMRQLVPNWSPVGANKIKHSEEANTVVPDESIQRVLNTRITRAASVKINPVRQTEPKMPMKSKTIGKSPKPLPLSVKVPKKVSSAPVKVSKPHKKIEAAFIYEERTIGMISDESNEKDPLQIITDND